MAQLVWTARARKQFRRIAKERRGNIRTAVGDLAAWPDCRNIKALHNREGFRLRVGRYRVLFTVHEGAVCIVRIEEVKKRDERTY